MIAMFISRTIISLVVILFATVSIEAQPLKDTSQRIDQLFTGISTATPGGVISISRQGAILYQKAFGMADLEHNVINTTETIFEAGSVSKQFTAASVLLLVKDGKIGLKDDIHTYFPDFPDYGYAITVEHLLHHTSGLRDWGSVAAIGGWPRGTRKYTPAHVKEIIWRQKQLNFIPGSEYSYSNSNYSMLVFLVEKVSGETLQQFTSEHLFMPIGMTHTRWRDNYNAIVPGRAIAYGKQGPVYEQNMPFENTFGHGALLTTVGDLEKWNRRWTNNTLGIDINKLQETKGVLNNGKEISYACGVVVNTVNGTKEISHTGATAGYRALLVYYPEKEISVIYLSNDAGAQLGKINSTISELLIGKNTKAKKEESYVGVNVAKESLTGKAGLYKHIREGDVQEFAVISDSLAFKGSGVKLIPIAENKFAKEGFVLEFPNGDTNPKTMLFQNPNGDTATYVRVNPFTGNGDNLNEYTGTYKSEEADVTVDVLVKEGKLNILVHPDTYIKLDPAFADGFFDEDMSFYQAIRSTKKKVTGFTVSVSRVRNLLFTKIK
jgi:CubicO group peptidase (beta-lactamase class C family)